LRRVAPLSKHLRELAGLYDIQLSYTDRRKRRIRAPGETVLAVLRALGAGVEGLESASEALRVRREELWRRRVDPVVVAWDGRLSPVRARLPASVAGRRVGSWVELESGERLELPLSERLEASSRAEIEGRSYVEGSLASRGGQPLPWGYHRLTTEVAGVQSTSLLVSAPPRATPPPEERRWGVFLPLHALRTRRTLGIGDLSDLQTLTEWTASRGGSMVATLPLLAGFLGDSLFEASPYSPASRLFWNELFVDPRAAPELERSPDARALLSSPAFRRDVDALGSRALVDYRATMAAKRRVLEALADAFWDGEGPRREAFEAFGRVNPRLFDYASFRAACERHRRWWGTWPARERDGRLPAEGGNPGVARYHAYVQWLAEQQLAATAQRARSRGADLYFDMPLGVNAGGYDAWRERAAFLPGVSAGAPPDAFFKEGQDWGFRPLSPEGIRAEGYRYPIEVVRTMSRHAGVVRIDHAMGMHRLFVVPTGMEAAKGLYIRYRPEEFYAILCLESRRSGTVLVGEDLGTVPLSVTQNLLRHGIQRTYVMQFELMRKGRRVRPPAVNALASFNTHDIPTFASFWRALDVGQWVELGLVAGDGVAGQMAERERQKAALVSHLLSERLIGPGEEGDDEAVLRAALGYLAGSPAKLVILALEDLWLETLPQNVPGTTTQYPNWRRRARFGFESFRRRAEVTSTLAQIDALRKGADQG
jgi:4-alpha-glucanotransferase